MFSGRISEPSGTKSISFLFEKVYSFQRCIYIFFILNYYFSMLFLYYRVYDLGFCTRIFSIFYQIEFLFTLQVERIQYALLADHKFCLFSAKLIFSQQFAYLCAQGNFFSRLYFQDFQEWVLLNFCDSEKSIFLIKQLNLKFGDSQTIYDT